MTTTQFNFKTNDNAVIEDWLPGDLREQTVEFSMKEADGYGKQVIDSQAATIEEYDGERSDDGMTRVSIELDSADTSNVGEYFGEFEATYEDGRVETFPKERYYFVTFTADIA